MYKHYFILAIRHLSKHRLFSGIKILGLTIAIASCLLIGLYINHEVNYDKIHEHAQRIVKANMEYRFGGETVLANVCGNKVATAFTQDFPEVQSGLRIVQFPQVVNVDNELYEEAHLYFADSTFFSMLSFPLVTGKSENVLDQPNEVVLTERLAKKYFSEENAVGKTLRIGTSSSDYVVSGVMKDVPTSTHIKPDLVVSFYSLANSQNETWWNANYATYFLLHPNVDVGDLQKKIPDYMQRHGEETGASGDDYLTFSLEKFLDIHLRSVVPGNFEAAGNILYIYILGFVGFLILLIACTTYINLTTATGAERLKEIGVQKVLGVSKSHLITQNLMESGMIMLITVVFGFMLARVSLPFFNQLFDRQLQFENLYAPDKFLSILSIALLVSLLSGIYPALVISRYEPLSALRGHRDGDGRRPTWLKRSLIIFQFGISILLIISALTLYYQMNFIKNKNLGFKQDLVITLPSDRTIGRQYETLKTQLQHLPEVGAVTTTYDSPTEIKGGYSVGQDPTGQGERPVTALPAGLDFLKTMSIALSAGQDISQSDIDNYERRDNDSTVISNILINEALANVWGWEPDQAVGKIASFNGRRSNIKGVIKDFHFASLHESIEPLVIFPSTGGRFILIKLNAGALEQSLDRIKHVWTSIVTHRPFSYHFMDEEFEEMYHFENQNARVTYVFTWLAIFLAALGLFGVASYGFTQRTKEIGIRKVLGSSVIGIFILLAKEYIYLVGIALLVATPLAWMTMQNWLEQFAYRINMQWWMFVLAGLLAFIITLVTLSFQGIQAALRNPIESLKQD